MHRLWEGIIKPILEAVHPQTIVEIGTEHGKQAEKILEYCKTNGSVLHIVDPLPKCDEEEWKAVHGKHLVFHTDLSLNALPSIPDPDAVLIDGDHNWYTVYNELKILESNVHNGDQFPVVFLHDIGWPYARRDLYYNPENIPADYRQPYKKQGMQPGQGELLLKGGFNAIVCNAVYENDLRNGVLTAIEDFLAESSIDFSFTALEGFHGLGILVSSGRLRASPELKPIIKGLQPPETLTDLMAAVERARILEIINYESDRMNHSSEQARFRKELKKVNRELVEKQATLERKLEELERMRVQMQRLEGQVKRGRQERERLELELGRTRQLQGKAGREMERISLTLQQSQESLENIRSVRDELLDQLDRYRKDLQKLHRAPHTPAGQPNPDFTNFEEYLRYSLVDFDAIKAPLTEVDRKVLGVMDSYKKHLADKYRNAPRDDLVSVVMPAYNRAHIIDFAIGSVLEQSYTNWELLIADDCGNDDTESVVRKHQDPRIKYFKLEKNLGASGARAAALEKAQGEYITYLDTDDAWDPDFILISVNVLKDSPGFHSIYSAQKVWQPHPDAQDAAEFIRDDEENLQFVRFASFNRPLLENRNFISMIAFMHDRAVLEKHGSFRTRRLEDWDLALRYTQASPAYSLPVVLSHYQFGRDELQRSRTLAGVRAQTLEQIDQVVRAVDLTPELRDYPAVSDHQLFGLTGETRRTGYDRPVSIVIVSSGAAKYLTVCLASVRKWIGPGGYEIIVVDNASDQAVVEYLKKDQRKHDDIKVIYNRSDAGIMKAANQGIRTASGDNDIVLLDHRAMVTPGWLPALQEALEAVQGIGIVAPRQTMLPGTSMLTTHVPICSSQREMDVTLSAHLNNILDPHLDRLRGFVELSFAPFFCAYITRETLRDVGLPEAVDTPPYRSEKLYCDAVRSYAKKRIVYTPHSKVYNFQRPTWIPRKLGIEPAAEKLHDQKQFKPLTKAKAPAAPKDPVPAGQRPSFGTYVAKPFKKHSAFDEYLRVSISDPFILQHPFTQEEEFVLDFMDYLKTVYRARYLKRKQDDLVSVIMPAYNRETIITRAIDSVLNQSYRNFELVVVDDGSKDRTVEVVKSIPDDRVKVLASGVNRGAAGARNHGIANSRGKYIAFLDSDDLWDPDYLLIMVNELKNHPGVRFANSALRMWWETDFEADPSSRRFRRIIFAAFNRALLENNNYISIIASVFERSLVDDYGLFDRGLKRMEDHELFLRYTEKENVLAVPIPLGEYIVEPERRKASLKHRGPATEAMETMRHRLRRGLELDLEDGFIEKDEPLFGLHYPIEPRRNGTVAIVIPSFECPEYLKLCIESLNKFTRDFELYIVDNGSSPEVVEYLRKIEGDRVKVVLNPWNQGFSHAVNQALEMVPPDRDVVILNNDIVVTPNWLDALAEAAYDDDSVGMAAPRQVFLANDPEVKNHVPFADGDREVDINLSLHHRNVLDPFYNVAKGLVELNFTAFFCVYIRSDALSQIKMLDHVTGFHYGSDSTFCSMVRHILKKRILYTNKSKVYHFHRRAAQHLKKTDKELHRAMFVVNKYEEIEKLRGKPDK